MSGVRVRPADLARLFGVTKQGVSGWIKDGRITLGADGRVDPRVAVNQLLTTGNPARLRAAFLKPLVTELDVARRRIRELEQALVVAKEDAEFHGASASGLIDLFEAFKLAIGEEWGELTELPEEVGLSALLAWLDAAMETGPSDRCILDFAARSEASKEGRGGDEFSGCEEMSDEG